MSDQSKSPEEIMAEKQSQNPEQILVEKSRLEELIKRVDDAEALAEERLTELQGVSKTLSPIMGMLSGGMSGGQLLAEAMANPDAFSFVTEIKPILEKYPVSEGN